MIRDEWTWPELQALQEHWKFEPPLPYLVARRWKIPPRQRPRMMSREEVIAEFTALGFGFSG